MHFKISLLGILLTLISTNGCSPNLEKEVRLATNASRETAAPILGGFDRTHPKTSLTREFLELKSARDEDFDCLWDTNFSTILKWQKDGGLRKHRWKLPSNWPEQFRAKDGTWIAFAPEAMVLMVNTDRLPDPVQYPTSILHVVSDRWISAPLINSESLPGASSPNAQESSERIELLLSIIQSHAAKFAIPGDFKGSTLDNGGSLDFTAWSSNLATKSQSSIQGHAASEQVIQGTVDWAIVTSSVALAAKEAGAPVEIVFPDQFAGGFGTVLIPQGCAVVNAAKSPNAAISFVNYLTSESVESRMVMGNAGCIPVHPSSTEVVRIKGESKVRWSQIDYERIYAD